MTVLKIAYWTGILIEVLTRVPIDRVRRSSATTEQRVSLTERILLGLLTLGGFILRVRAEEKMMLDTFGERYRAYMNGTGTVFPKL